MEIHIDNMTLDDIVELEPVFSELFDSFWSIKTLQDDFLDEHSKYIVAKSNNKILGFAGIKIVLDEADIMNIVVNINYRKLGIGSMLLESLINIAKSLNCKCITLEVNETNTSAFGLYKKYHFERIGFRKKYYNNTYNAILMKKEL